MRNDSKQDYATRWCLIHRKPDFPCLPLLLRALCLALLFVTSSCRRSGFDEAESVKDIPLTGAIYFDERHWKSELEKTLARCASAERFHDRPAVRITSGTTFELVQKITNRLLTSIGEDPSQYQIYLFKNPNKNEASVLGCTERAVFISDRVLDDTTTESEVAMAIAHGLGHARAHHRCAHPEQPFTFAPQTMDDIVRLCRVAKPLNLNTHSQQTPDPAIQLQNAFEVFQSLLIGWRPLLFGDPATIQGQRWEFEASYLGLEILKRAGYTIPQPFPKMALYGAPCNSTHYPDAIEHAAGWISK